MQTQEREAAERRAARQLEKNPEKRPISEEVKLPSTEVTPAISEAVKREVTE